MGAINTTAEEFDDYFDYTFVSKTELRATLKESAGTVDQYGTIVVPSQHNGKKVVAVAGFKYAWYAKVVLPEGIQRIDNQCFMSCSFLTEIVMPSTITRIGTEAFSGCKLLTNITIPKNVKEIGDNAFYGTDLTSAVFENPNNWERYKRGDYSTSRSSVDASTLADPAKAAKLLTETYLTGSGVSNRTYVYGKR